VSVAGLERSVFTTPDGADIVYRTRRGRNPLVLLHGLGCDASMWDAVAAALPTDLGLVIPELRGHGESTLGWRPPSVDVWADDVVRLLRQRRIESPAIAGLSLGGYAALGIAAAHPGFARAFALVSTTAAPDDEAGKQRRAAAIAMIRRVGWRPFTDALVPSLLNDNRPQFTTHREHLLKMFERAGDSGLPPTLMALAARPDRRPMLLSIHVPVIVVVGAVDALTPPDRARALATGISGSRLHVLDDVAHMSALEAPQRVAGLLGAL
jgi:pimeloyl-ACP methyl ester carboxylesterase